MTQLKYDARYRHGIEDEQLQYFDIEVQYKKILMLLHSGGGHVAQITLRVTIRPD